MKTMKAFKIFAVGLFLIVVSAASFSFAEARIKEFISQGKSLEIFYKQNNIKAIDQKFRGPGYTLGTGPEDFPQEVFPYYIFYINVAKTAGSSGSVPRMGEIVLTHFFYIDAYTGKVLTDAEAQMQGLITESSGEMRYHKISLPKVTGVKGRFISAEKAFKYIEDLPEIKFIEKKYYPGWSVSEEVSPTKEFPFYKIKYCVKDETKRAPGAFVNNLFSQDFYVQAYTGDVYFDENVRKNILPMMKEEKIELAKEAELKKADQIFEKQMQEAYAEIEKYSYDPHSIKYKDALTKYLPFFLKGLQVHTADIRSAAIRILSNLARRDVMFGQYKAREAIPQLRKLLKDTDYGVRYNAADALGYIVEPGEEEVMVLLRALINDSNSLVRRTSIEALGRLKDAVSIPSFIELLDDVVVNQAIVNALAEIKDERAVVPLIEKFDKKDSFYLQQSIIYALGEIGSVKSAQFLINLFDKQYITGEVNGIHFEVKVPRQMGKDAADALAKIDKEAVSYLFESLKSQDYFTRVYSVYALGLIKDPFTLDPLNKSLLTEENPAIKSYIEESISKIKGEPYISPLIKQLRVSVKPAKLKFWPGEKIKMSLLVKNTGPLPVIINTVAEEPFSVEAISGKLIRIRYEDKTAIPQITKDKLVTLKSGQIYKSSVVTIYRSYVFGPGRYKIIGGYWNYDSAIEFGVYALTGKIDSEPVIIEVGVF